MIAYDDPRSLGALGSIGEKLSSLLEDREIANALRQSLVLSALVTSLVKEVGITFSNGTIGSRSGISTEELHA